MSVTIRAAGLRITERAVQIDLDGETHWLPKSQINLLNGAPLGDVVSFTDRSVLHEFVISDWIAEQKGFTMREEKYTVDEAHVRIVGDSMFAVRCDGALVGYGKTYRQATMIAAALNMTQGKL